MTRSEELAKEGWEKQGTSDDSHLSESVEMCQEIGFEMRLESFDPEGELGCAECMKVANDKYKTIYTRRR